MPKVMPVAANSRGRFEAVMRPAVELFAEDSDRARLLLREALDRSEFNQRAMDSEPILKIVFTAGRTIRVRRDASDVTWEINSLVYIICSGLNHSTKLAFDFVSTVQKFSIFRRFAILNSSFFIRRPRYRPL